MDYQKLVDVLNDGRNLIRPCYYCSIGVPPSPGQVKFHQSLQYRGFRVVAKPLMRGKEKGVDIALATHLLAMGFKNAYDVAIVVSGDKDYVEAIEEVRSLGKRVEGAAFRASAAPEIRRSVDQFTFLDDILAQIGYP